MINSTASIPLPSVIRISAFACVFWLSAHAAFAGPCAVLKSNPEPWVQAKVDLLIQSARRAYENDNSVPAYERVLDSIVRTMHNCQLSTDPEFLKHYQTFADYIATLSLDRMPDHELGFVASDEQYFADTKQFVEIPSFLLDPLFLKFVSRYETLDRAKAYLQQENEKRDAANKLIFFSYQSRHLGTPDNDNSYRRLLIVVPGDPLTGAPDKWVQFGVTDPGLRARVRNVSVVTAVKRDDGTYNAFFKDFFRSYQRDGSITIKGRWELGEGDDNCASCHKSGVLPIFPVDGSVPPAEVALVDQVNARFRSYGSPRFGGYLDARKLGPGLSTQSSDDRLQRFGATFPDSVVARSMVCSSCHNAERLGPLNWPMDKTVIHSYITGGQMPFGQQLTDLDRRQLYAKLIEEYFSIAKNNPGILKSWLLGRGQ